MIRLNRTTEYGLMALRHISRKHLLRPLEVTSAREIADSYGLPFEITAKTLQRLRDTGLIQSAQGARGGYLLLRPLAEISLAEFLNLMEGPQSMVVCASPSLPTLDEAQTSQSSNPAVSAPLSTSSSVSSAAAPCEYGKKCEIKHVMNRLNTRFVQFLSDICLAELAEESTQLLPFNENPIADLKPAGLKELSS